LDRELITTLRKKIEPVLDPEGIELVDIEFRMERGKWILRLYIDTPGGIGLKHCELVSRQVGALLDMEDPIEHTYHLEVSSPGINRILRREKDFRTYAGSPVRIKTRHKLNGRRNFHGILKGVEHSKIILEVDGKRIEISLEELEKARLDLPETELFRKDLQRRGTTAGD
jgi:ribosome maturation factor RimP